MNVLITFCASTQHGTNKSKASIKLNPILKRAQGDKIAQKTAKGLNGGSGCFVKKIICF